MFGINNGNRSRSQSTPPSQVHVVSRWPLSPWTATMLQQHSGALFQFVGEFRTDLLYYWLSSLIEPFKPIGSRYCGGQRAGERSLCYSLELALWFRNWEQCFGSRCRIRVRARSLMNISLALIAMACSHEAVGCRTVFDAPDSVLRIGRNFCFNFLMITDFVCIRLYTILIDQLVQGKTFVKCSICWSSKA